jgi:hypothetical protein
VGPSPLARWSRSSRRGRRMPRARARASVTVGRSSPHRRAHVLAWACSTPIRGSGRGLPRVRPGRAPVRVGEYGTQFRRRRGMQRWPTTAAAVVRPSRLQRPGHVLAPGGQARCSGPSPFLALASTTVKIERSRLSRNETGDAVPPRDRR